MKVPSLLSQKAEAVFLKPNLQRTISDRCKFIQIAPNNKVKFRKSFFKGIVCANEIEAKETTFVPHSSGATPRRPTPAR